MFAVDVSDSDGYLGACRLSYNDETFCRIESEILSVYGNPPHSLEAVENRERKGMFGSQPVSDITPPMGQPSGKYKIVSYIT